jgi:hypothetical protein
MCVLRRCFPINGECLLSLESQELGSGYSRNSAFCNFFTLQCRSNPVASHRNPAELPAPAPAVGNLESTQRHSRADNFFSKRQSLRRRCPPSIAFGNAVGSLQLLERCRRSNTKPPVCRSPPFRSRLRATAALARCPHSRPLCNCLPCSPPDRPPGYCSPRVVIRFLLSLFLVVPLPRRWQETAAFPRSSSAD